MTAREYFRPLIGRRAEFTCLLRAGSDAVKDVVLPIYEAVPRHGIRGLYEDFYQISERVLLLRGEVHLGRKPVSIVS